MTKIKGRIKNLTVLKKKSTYSISDLHTVLYKTIIAGGFFFQSNENNDLATREVFTCTCF